MKEHKIELHFKGLDGYQLIRPSLSLFIQKALPNKHSLFEVAVNEAINNALHYGKTISFPQSVIVKMDVIGNHWVVVRVKDPGKGFQVHDALKRLHQGDSNLLEACLMAESGRGLLIMKSAADRLYYNHQGNEVILAKLIQ